MPPETIAVFQTICIVWIISGWLHSVYCLISFFRWLIRTNHSMHYDKNLIIKWLVLIALVTAPTQVVVAMYCISLIYILLPIWYLCLSVIVYILYKFNFAKKYELLIPLLFWSQFIIFMLYKKHQTKLLHETHGE
jgi:hypothetical protein